MAVDFEAVKHLVECYANDVRNVYSVERVVLYGSYAKGIADEMSDIDVCFFINDFGDKRRVDILRELLGMMRKYKKVPFEPIVFPTDEIQNDNPFVKEILRTGIEVSCGS